MSPELLLTVLTILPLSVAAGVDLYLTLLFLGGARRLGWDSAPPGGLGDLAVPAILLAAAIFYVFERWMERRALPSLYWNAAHTVVRTVAGAQLALLALAGLPLASRVAGAVAAGALTLAVHVTRSGWGLLLALIPARDGVRLLVSVAEDAGVLAILSLSLDAPVAAVALALFAVGAGAVGGRSAAVAFAFALGLLWDSGKALLREPRWQGPERFPAWVRRALDDPLLAPGGGLRGSPAGAFNLPGIGLFRRGWVVVRGGSPLFLYRRRRRTQAFDLGELTPLGVTPSGIHTRIEMGAREGAPLALYFGLSGPGPEDLQAEFFV